MMKKTNQSTMNKIASGLIGGTILFLILNFIVKPLIEEKKVNKESISKKCEKINLSENTENNFLSDLCKKMNTDSQTQQKQSQNKNNWNAQKREQVDRWLCFRVGVGLGMKKKYPNFMSNSRLEVSNSCYKNNDFVIGDTEDVLDIKNQYLIQTYFVTNDEFDSVKKVNDIKNLSCSSIVGDGEEEYLAGYCDYTIYPLIDIKIKGSGISDILKKNNHAPTGFFLIHDTTAIHRRDFDLYDNFFNFTKKKYLKKTIKITSKSMCFAPLFDSELSSIFYDHPMQSDGKRLIKPFEEFDKEKVKSFQKELNKLKKQKKRMEHGSIVKYAVDNGTYDVYRPEYKGGGLIFVLKK